MNESVATKFNDKKLNSETDKPSRAWLFLHHSFRWYDQCYRRMHQLYDVDDFISVVKKRYRGESMQFDDGTRLAKDDSYLVLHFNNDFLLKLYQGREMKSPRRAALSFGVAIVNSMQRLDKMLQHNPNFNGVKVITGITWFKTHGGKIGFESRPLPQGWRKTYLRWHFRLLLRALFPHLADRESQRLQPHQFWLTRPQLRNAVTQEDNYVAQRLSQYNQPQLVV